MVSKYIRSFMVGVAAAFALVGTALACDTTLSGQIDTATVRKVQETLRKAKGPKTICFADSAGGYIAAGLEIWEELSSYQPGATTVLLPNSRCLSACAVAFMGGQKPIGRGVRSPARFMDSSSKLGFHRPYIPLDNVSAKDLAKFVRFSAQISRRLSNAKSFIRDYVAVTTKIPNTRYAISSTGYIGDASVGFHDNFYRAFPAFVLREMYKRDPNEFYYITDKYDAFRNGIFMTDINAPDRANLSNEELNDVCKLYDAAFSLYSWWSYANFERVYKNGVLYFKLPAKDVYSSTCWILPRDDLAGYQVVTTFTAEGNASIDVEQFQTIKESNLNLIPYAVVNRSKGPVIDRRRCKKYLINDECLSRKELVVRIQRSLKAKDCYNGKIDGIFGAGTKKALAILEIEFNNRVLTNIASDLMSSNYFCMTAPAASSGDVGCGWYLITSCSRNYFSLKRKDSQCGATAVVNTSGRQFPNFRNGFFCAVAGPLSKTRATQLQRSAARQGCSSAYIKRNC